MDVAQFIDFASLTTAPASVPIFRSRFPPLSLALSVVPEPLCHQRFFGAAAAFFGRFFFRYSLASMNAAR